MRDSPGLPPRAGGPQPVGYVTAAHLAIDYRERVTGVVPLLGSVVLPEEVTSKAYHSESKEKTKNRRPGGE